MFKTVIEYGKVKVMRTKPSTSLAIGITFLICVIGLFNQMHYLSQVLAKPLMTSSIYNPNIKNIIFPKTFGLLKGRNDLLYHYNLYFNESFNANDFDQLNVVKYDDSVVWSAPLVDKPYHTKTLSLYEHKESSCSKNKQDFNLEISDNIEFDNGLEEMSIVFQNHLDTDPLFKELRPYFNDDIMTQLKIGTTAKHWYKFAGSSVWLEEFGVHFMISRIIYSPVGNKRKPILSLTYAQIFDDNWNELKDVELIVPSMDENDNSFFKDMTFPRFLPIPFYHNPSFTSKVYYGTEDPRLFLVKNEFNKMEPLIIFNAHHRKIVSNEVIDQKSTKIGFEYYRSMFLSWPFRYQKGKVNVDGMYHKEYEKLRYNKVVELRRSDVPRLAVQKNWTPMLKHSERQDHGYDKFIYFVYRWSKLEILKCNLDGFVDGTSECDYEYKQMMDSSKEEVGPLRGGTEMINIRDIVKDISITLPDKEIWIGFPRAHIKACGCGKDMYRPNLAVITREGDDKYKISQLSSFTSFDIEVYGWTNPKILCASRDPNALISNGVSNWEFKNGHDILTLSLSVADATNNIVHIKDVLRNLIAKTSILSIDPTDGYDDIVVDCALEESTRFCKAYGEEMKLLGKVPPPEPDY